MVRAGVQVRAVVRVVRPAGGGHAARAGLETAETGGAAGAGSPLYSNEWNQMLRPRTDGARRSETGNVRCALLSAHVCGSIRSMVTGGKRCYPWWII